VPPQEGGGAVLNGEKMGPHVLEAL